MASTRREQLEAAGRWLRQERERRGFATVKAFAERLGVDPSMASNYERGIHAVTDERAEQIAGLFDMPVVDVRRGLGLWVPEMVGLNKATRIRQRDARIVELRRIADELRTAIDELSG